MRLDLRPVQATGVEWRLIDANRPIGSIQEEIKEIAGAVIEAAKGTEIAPLWPRAKGDGC